MREGEGKYGTFQLVNTLKMETHSSLQDAIVLLTETVQFTSLTCFRTVTSLSVHKANLQTRCAIICNSRLYTRQPVQKYLDKIVTITVKILTFQLKEPMVLVIEALFVYPV